MALSSYYETVTPLVVPSGWIHTGSYSLDMLMGRGAPRGRVIQVYGPPGSRKSTITILAAATAQSRHSSPVCVGWWDTEGGWLEHVGAVVGLRFDPPKLTKKAGNYGLFSDKAQKVMTGGLLIEDDAETIEDFFKSASLLARACAAGGVTPFIVCDPLSALSTQRERQAGYFRETQMDNAKAIRKGLRLVMSDLRRAGGVMYILDHETQTGVRGGTAVPYLSSFRMRVELEYEWADDPEVPCQEDQTPTGVRCTVTSDKSRFAPRMKCPIVFSYEYGIDRSYDLLWAGTKAGIVTQKPGGWIIVGENGKLGKYQGVAAWRRAWFERFDARWDRVRTWFERRLDTYYAGVWRGFCERGGIDPDEFLGRFKSDITRAYVADQESAAAVPEEMVD